MMTERAEAAGPDAPVQVLIVDDDRDGAEMLAELIELLGHRARVANTAAGAMSALDSEQPDVILLDLGLPDENGYGVARAIRSRFGEKIRLVAVTGYAGAEPRARARSAGFDAFLTKPVLVDDLVREVGGEQRSRNERE